MDHLSLDRGLTLVVHDWGGMIGMAMAVKHRRAKLADLVKEAVETDISSDLKEAMNGWLGGMDDAEKSKIGSIVQMGCDVTGV